MTYADTVATLRYASLEVGALRRRDMEDLINNARSQGVEVEWERFTKSLLFTTFYRLSFKGTPHQVTSLQAIIGSWGES